MSASDNISGEQFKGHLSFNRWHGTAFRITQTPEGAAHSTTGEKLSHDPDRWSIVTPENGDAFHWPAARKELQVVAKKRWNDIQKDPRSQYKMDQIRRSIVKGKKK